MIIDSYDITSEPIVKPENFCHLFCMKPELGGSSTGKA